MAKIICTYQGGLRCEASLPSIGASVLTDAPPENKGKGEHMSPTDLLGAALGSCLLTMMGFVAESEGIALDEVVVEVEKAMAGPPHRVAKLNAVVRMPAGLNPEQRQRLENFARQCPVHRSLSAEMETPISFVYPD